MQKIIKFLNEYKVTILAFVSTITLVGSVEFFLGRIPFGPDGKFGLWDGDIWNSEMSQRVADPYSASHFIHGILFFALLWLVLRKVPKRYRLLIAVIIESAWEVLENSPLIINRYREVTISIGYVGDSILNSISDILFMSLGFFFASRVRVWTSVAVVVFLELLCLFWVRDNLTLNIIMLVHPLESIRAWQSVGHTGI